MLRRIAIVTIMLCLAVSAKAQDTDDEEESNPVVDSLLREYAAATSDTARFRLCERIGSESNNLDTVIKYSTIGISLFDGSDTTSYAYCYSNLGWAYNLKEQYDKAIDNYKKSIELFRAVDSISVAIMYSINLSRAYHHNNAYSDVWRTLYDALNEAQQHSDTVNMCYCYYSFADFYDDYAMKQQGIEAADKVYKLAEQSRNYDDMLAGAAIMAELLSLDADANSYKESIKWSYKALECYNKASKKEDFYISIKGDVYTCLIDSYLALAEIEGNDAYVDSASHYVDLGDAFAANADWDDYLILSCKGRAMVRYARHDYKGAEKLLHEALKFACDNDIHAYDMQIYKNLSKTCYNLGDYRNALKYYELYREEQAPLRGPRAIMEAAAFEVRSVVEQEQADAEYERLKIEKELEDGRQHFSRMMFVSAVGLVSLLVFVFVLWRMLQNTRKGNAVLLSHNEEIKTQNEELNIEKAKIAEINSKIRQSMSYARRIQMATVSSEAEIEEVFANSMVYNKPCEVVSGDWSWASRIGSKRILALGGSAKIGVPGALVSMITVNALKDTIGQLSAMSAVSPTAILRTVQSKLPEAARNNAAGLSLCVFGRGSVRYAGINQNAVLLKDGNTILMPCDKPGDMFHTVTEGDIVMLYSTATLHELSARSTTPEMLCSLLYQKSPVEQKEDVSIVSIII